MHKTGLRRIQFNDKRKGTKETKAREAIEDKRGKPTIRERGARKAIEERQKRKERQRTSRGTQLELFSCPFFLGSF